MMFFWVSNLSWNDLNVNSSILHICTTYLFGFVNANLFFILIKDTLFWILIYNAEIQTLHLITLIFFSHNTGYVLNDIIGVFIIIWIMKFIKQLAIIFFFIKTKDVIIITNVIGFGLVATHIIIYHQNIIICLNV